MQIEAGKYYRTRGGQVFGPMVPHQGHTNYPWCLVFSEPENSWTEDGWWSMNGRGHMFDLVAEVYVSDTPPVLTPSFIHPALDGPSGPFLMVPETKTLRDEFAMAALNWAMVEYHDKPSATCDNIAKWAYNLVDAMMEARKK